MLGWDRNPDISMHAACQLSIFHFDKSLTAAFRCFVLVVAKYQNSVLVSVTFYDNKTQLLYSEFNCRQNEEMNDVDYYRTSKGCFLFPPHSTTGPQHSYRVRNKDI